MEASGWGSRDDCDVVVAARQGERTEAVQRA